MNQAQFQRLESFVSQGRVNLFTGAGFSLGASSKATKEALPSVAGLTEALWEVAFPGEPYDGSGLQDVFEAGLLQARRGVVDLLNERLTVDPESLPEYYRRWFSLPWNRVYTLNVDDLANAASRRFDLPYEIRSVSALTDPLTTGSDAMTVVHLNGSLEDVPDITFTGRQYGERQATPDLWYAALARELASQPFLFVGTTLDEPPLWQYIEARGVKPRRGRELRPGSFLVTPKLSRARGLALRQYQVDWVDGTGESFEQDVLACLDDAAKTGLKRALRAPSREQTLIPLDDATIDDAQGDEREFLLGRAPRWADLADGFATERDFDRSLLEQVQYERPGLVVVTGTAGAGKSASAMRMLLALRAEGDDVAVLNADADLRGYRIRKAVQESDAAVLWIDDLDRFGRVRDILDDLHTARPDLLVVAALRSTRYDALGLSALVESRSDALEAAAPPLADGDIDGLLDRLEQANRLGTLKGKTRAQQRVVMAEKCGRQLLVAMIEATSGERFEAKVDSECRELGAEAAVIYCVVALASNFRIPLHDAELMASLGGDPAATIRHVDSLIRTHLLIRDTKGRITLRHRVIAERAVNFFRAARLVETPLAGLIFALAAGAQPGQLKASPQGRGVIRLMNHRLLIEFLRTADKKEPDVEGIRRVFEDIESILSQDYHYWLQRGGFETEEGDLNLAKNFIEQARTLAPDDVFVRTQWAYMTLKRASRNPETSGSKESVAEAFLELDEVIARRGRQDSYPFHVYGSQGLAWANRAGLTHEDTKLLLQQLRGVVDEGLELHRTNRELRRLARDLESAYLNLAVPKDA